MIQKGFKFGLLLQFAVGPVCLFIFQSAVSAGLFPSLSGVLAVSIVDSLFIVAAIWGISRIIDKENVKLGLKIFGSVILCFFGLSTILSQFEIVLLPVFSLQRNMDSVFLKALLLTISNPLTIIFWAGVFATQISEEKYVKNQLGLFGLGAVLSTLVFLTGIALLGSATGTFLPHWFIQGLNLAVGIVLTIFGVKLALKKLESPRQG